MHHKQPERSGVLLLIVLSLLVLFTLVGVTFIVTAGQFQRTASQGIRVERAGDSPQVLTKLALQRLLVGTNNKENSIFGHDLLRDAYGADFMKARINNVAVLANQQLISIDFDPPTTGSIATDAYYSGCVFTLLDEPELTNSTRVVRYAATARNLIIEPFPGQERFVPQVGQVFLINGRPFNGVGAGLDVANFPGLTQQVTFDLDRDGSDDDLDGDSMPDSFDAALLPHFGAYSSTSSAAPIDPYDVVVNGRADEAYDAADFQNMFLAWMPADISLQSAMNIPSFHRPSVVNHFNSSSGRNIPWTQTTGIPQLPLADFWAQ